MVEIQLDTYTAHSISAHRIIRQGAFCPSLTNSLFLSCNSYVIYISKPDDSSVYHLNALVM